MKNKNKILTFLIIFIFIILVYLVYINITFMVSNNNLIKKISSNDINNFDIYINTIYTKETFKISEDDKSNFLNSLQGITVRHTDNIINGVSRNFIVKFNNENDISINITNSTISINGNTYRIINGSISIFEDIYFKYTGKNFN